MAAKRALLYNGGTETREDRWSLAQAHGRREHRTMNIKISGFEKLKEYAASFVGDVTELMSARWRAKVTADTAQIEAQGEAEALRIKAEGQADALAIIGKATASARENLPKGTLLQGHVEMHDPLEIETRLNFQEQKRTGNLYRVIEMAAENLKGREVDNHEIDHDWTARFFADVQDVTSENMQQIWAKILAGEVEKPGRTSFHTLAILKNMTQRDAELFSKASRFVFNDFIFREEEYVRNIAGFPSLGEFVKLESYSLLRVSQFLQQNISVLSANSCNARDRKALYKIFAIGERTDIDIPCYVLTPQGVELYGFTEATLDLAYTRELAKFISGRGFQLKQAQILEEIDGGGYRCSRWATII